MSRFFLNDPRVRLAVEKLVLLYIQHGSVNRLCEVLETAAACRIYPNRLHALLSGDENQAINSRTLEVIEEGLGKLNTPDPVGLIDPIKELRDEYRDRGSAGIPFAVLKYVLEDAAGGDEDQGSYALETVRRLVGTLDGLKGGALVARRNELLPLLRRLALLTTQYVKMLETLES